MMACSIPWRRSILRQARSNNLVLPSLEPPIFSSSSFDAGSCSPTANCDQSRSSSANSAWFQEQGKKRQSVAAAIWGQGQSHVFSPRSRVPSSASDPVFARNDINAFHKTLSCFASPIVKYTHGSQRGFFGPRKWSDIIYTWHLTDRSWILRGIEIWRELRKTLLHTCRHPSEPPQQRIHTRRSRACGYRTSDQVLVRHCFQPPTSAWLFLPIMDLPYQPQVSSIFRG